MRVQRTTWIVLWAAMLTTAAPSLQADGPARARRSVSSTAPENVFPFTICGDQFCLDGSPAFLNILGYAPLEPCQDFDDLIREGRIQEDLERFHTYQGGCDPVVLRVYPQPTEENPIRMPKYFYDGVRKLGFWVIRDIYFPAENCNYQDGYAAIDAVIAEVEAAGAMDLIFAWEFGNEFQDAPCRCDTLATFLDDMCAYLKGGLNEPGRESFSNLVTWASYPPHDLLYTEPGSCPIDVTCVSYYSQNAYSYWPERVRDHQGGKGTGTPFAGYLAALKEYLPDKPLVISETGLPDSSTVGDGDQLKLKPWYPIYRWGGLNADQVAEGLADRYWDARLAGVSGITIFEWNDEWWKAGQLCAHNDAPEEYFGLLTFDKYEPNVHETARFKLQQQAVRDLYTMCLPTEPPSITLIPAATSIPKNEHTTIRAEVSGAVAPVRLRWEARRGHIVGDSDTVTFYAGGRALGPATVAATIVDANQRANTDSAAIGITTSDSRWIECLTFGPGRDAVARASGRVGDVDLNAYKVVVYIHDIHGNKFYVQPQYDENHPEKSMTSIWIRPDGYWWTQIHNEHDGDLLACLVPASFPAQHEERPPEWKPEEAVACDRLDEPNDTDNDLLLDTWEDANFGHRDYDRYHDPDVDLADNLEEFLSGGNTTIPDNDSDSDDLPDTWEYVYFGTLDYNADDDPDADGLDNHTEFTLGIHPGRTAADRDRDGLPDTWEIHWCSTLHMDPEDLCRGGYTNRDAYDLAKAPCCDTDCRCIYDLDNNCNVAGGDLGLFAGCWLCRDTEPCWQENACEEKDFDCNGLVAGGDLGWFAGAWLKRCEELDPCTDFPPCRECDGSILCPWPGGQAPIIACQTRASAHTNTIQHPKRHSHNVATPSVHMSPE